MSQGRSNGLRGRCAKLLVGSFYIKALKLNSLFLFKKFNYPFKNLS